VTGYPEIIFVFIYVSSDPPRSNGNLGFILLKLRHVSLRSEAPTKKILCYSLSKLKPDIGGSEDKYCIKKSLVLYYKKILGNLSL